MATTKASEPPATGGGVRVGDDDYTKDAVQQQQAQVLAAPHQEDDYPVERVEAVYRKLDLRIIPGTLAHTRHIRPIMSHRVTPTATSRSASMDLFTYHIIAQPSGSSTSSAPPSAPTSGSPRP